MNFTPIIMISSTLAILFNIISSFISTLGLIIYVRPNIVVFSVPRGETAFGACIAASICRRIIFFDHRDEWEDYLITTSHSRIYKAFCILLKKLMTKCYQQSKMVITVTEMFANNLDLRGVHNVKIVPNGAETHIFRPHNKLASRLNIGINPDDFLFVFSGSIGFYYRVDIVLKAIAKLKSEGLNPKLILVGRPLEITTIMELANRLNLEDQVLYLGSKEDKTELAQIICACDIGLVPYDSNPLWKNTLPVKALEYLACGLPVIASAHQGSCISELLCKNGVGFVIPPENVDKLAKVMKAVMLVKFSDDYRNHAISLIRAEFDRQLLAHKFLDIIKEHS